MKQVEVVNYRLSRIGRLVGCWMISRLLLISQMKVMVMFSGMNWCMWNGWRNFIWVRVRVVSISIVVRLIQGCRLSMQKYIVIMFQVVGKLMKQLLVFFMLMLQKQNSDEIRIMFIVSSLKCFGRGMQWQMKMVGMNMQVRQLIIRLSIELLKCGSIFLILYLCVRVLLRLFISRVRLSQSRQVCGLLLISVSRVSKVRIMLLVVMVWMFQVLVLLMGVIDRFMGIFFVWCLV